VQKKVIKGRWAKRESYQGLNTRPVFAGCSKGMLIKHLPFLTAINHTTAYCVIFAH
jgi:hypothetical protein